MTPRNKPSNSWKKCFANIPDVLGVRLWNGKPWPDERPRVATLVLQHPNALARILSAGTEAGLAEAYLNNDSDLEGDIEAAFECVPWDQDAVALDPPQYLSGEEMFELAVDENRQ